MNEEQLIKELLVNSKTYTILVGASVSVENIDRLKNIFPTAKIIVDCSTGIRGHDPMFIVTDDLSDIRNRCIDHSCEDANLEDHLKTVKLERERSGPWYRRFERKRRSR